jgi:hypothetical protein
MLNGTPQAAMDLILQRKISSPSSLLNLFNAGMSMRMPSRSMSASTLHQRHLHFREELFTCSFSFSLGASFS